MKKGFSLIEVVVTVSLLGIVFFLMNPMIKSFSKVNNRVKTQKKIDHSFSYVSDILKKDVRASKKTGNDANQYYAGIYDSFNSDSSLFFSSKVNNPEDTGNVLLLEIPYYDDTSDSYESNLVFFSFEDSQLIYRKGFSGNKNVLIDNVEKASFKFQEGIIVYHINLDVGKYEGLIRDSIRSSISTRIDFAD